MKWMKSEVLCISLGSGTASPSLIFEVPNSLEYASAKDLMFLLDLMQQVAALSTGLNF